MSHINYLECESYEPSLRRSKRLGALRSFDAAKDAGCAEGFAFHKDFKTAGDLYLEQSFNEACSVTEPSFTTKKAEAVKRSAAKGSSTPLRKTFSPNSKSGKCKSIRDFTPKFKRRCEPNFSSVQMDDSTNFAGLPSHTFELYKETKKILSLYEWQEECLSNQCLLTGGNLVVCLPTGSGKTLIAEVAMLREVVVNKRNCLFIVPYVAIAQEKVISLSTLSQVFEIWIEEYAGSKGRIPPIKRLKCSIYVATIEKASMIINSLITENRINELGVVVVDELHMLGEGERGAIIEQTLSKFMMAGNGQIIGISATLANIDEVTSFLRASTFTTNFRPVKLVQRVKIDNMLYKVSDFGELEEEKILRNSNSSKDPDNLISLLHDIIPESSAIIFCPSKVNCENVCSRIAKLAPRTMRERKKVEKTRLMHSIREEQDGKMCEVLRMGIQCGVAFHHSGLTADERKLLEDAFQEGVISVICSTSTLSAGVNLPAKRVIIKHPLVGKEPLKKMQYLQMIGRAGRPGFDTEGDAITIVRPGDEANSFISMLKNGLEDCRSSLANEDSLTSFLLDLISLEITNSKEEIYSCIKETLYGIQFQDFGIAVDSSLHKLMNSNLVAVDALLQKGKYHASLVGNAAFSASIAPCHVKIMEEMLLENLSKGIVFSSHFHLILIIIPFDVYCDVNWNVFYDEYKALSEGEQSFLERIKVEERYLVRCMLDTPKLKIGDICLRIYITFMMLRIWKRDSLTIVASKFSVTRGWLFSVLQSTCSQASSVARFSEMIIKKIPSLWPLRHLLPNLVQHLRECKQQELIPLLALDCVKVGRARQLYDLALGYKKVGDVARADPLNLMNQLNFISKRQAKAIVLSAQNIIRERISEKLEELQEMGAASPHLIAQLVEEL